MERVMAAMSGGVDSAVAALLLQREGCSCRGVTMRLVRGSDLALSPHKSCCSSEDAEDAAFVCYQLGIEHELVDFSGLFRHLVIQKFISEYEHGRTPNPCLDCNRALKFTALLDYAQAQGFDAIATGHYARITRAPSGRYELRKARDESKDQSYVLYMLTQEQLAHLRLPLGELYKTQTRALAQEAGLVNAHKHDSQDICFLPDGDIGCFWERWTGEQLQPGEIRGEDGKLLGTHRGALCYTLGQRRGLGVAAGAPLYVVGKDMAANTVFVGAESALYRRALIAERMNWLSIPAPEGAIRAAVRARYRQTERPATVTPLPGGGARIVFDEPQRALTPAQAVVLYDGELVLGGGTIARVEG